MDAPAEVPEGFARHSRRSAVTDPWEPIYSRLAEGALQIGLRLRPEHCNSRGLVHGAVIAALADNAMGLTYVHALRAANGEAAAAGAVTVTLTVDYAAPAPLGAWLQVSPRLIRAGRTLGLVDALVTADADTVARASASFRAV